MSRHRHPRGSHLPFLPTALALAAFGLAAAPEAKRAGPGPLSPAESLGRFKVAEGLAIELLLAEPAVAQPVFLDFDERGRMWVVEYRQYPEPAGLKVLSRDSVWRIVYDKVPLPPPKGVRGADRITIHEDADGDGTFETHSTFVDGLNIATACAQGRGGVWVLNPPYLLFYPDRDRDDVPDGDPEVHLEGFGLEDTHSVVNSLRWGPDGWLYATQGSTVTGRVRRPGTDDKPVHSMGQLVWRYHPETRRYEVFAEGGGNAFGVEIDSKGRVYSGHNGGDTRGFHYVQGGYFRKGFDKHGPLSNPYAFGYFDAMKHPRVPRFTHTFLIYDGDALPAEYHGRLLGVAPLLSHVVLSDVIRDGSTFRTNDLSFPLTTTDRWFRPVDIKLGPDGALYVADWYDGQVNHYRNHEGQIDRSNGRVYRLRAAGAAPVKPFDLASKSTDQLIDLLSHPNRWFRDTAKRLLGDRKDATAVPRLTSMMKEGTGQAALEALWALNLCGGFNDRAALAALGHADPYVRLWGVRLLGDAKEVTGGTHGLAIPLAVLAAEEPDVEVRSQLACTARRLPADQGLAIVANLIDKHDDSRDPHLPLLLWWAIESKAETDRDEVLKLFRDREFWSRPVVRQFLTERLMRRYAAAGTRKGLLTCAELLRLAPGPDDAKRLFSGFEAALSGRPLPGLPDELAEALGRFQGGSVLLGLRQGKPEAVDEALKTLADDRADRGQRLRYVQVFGEVEQPRSVPALMRLAARSTDPALQAAALVALTRYKDPAIGSAVVVSLPDLTDDTRGPALALLASRPAWALQLLEAVDAGKVDPKSVPAEVVQRLLRHRDPAVAALLRNHFGDVRPATPAELQAEIERLADRVRSGPGEPLAGQRLFNARCASCHALYGQGGKVGPDLTTYRRDDLETMLLNVVNPSAEVREGYGSFLAATADGRALTGVLIDQDPQVVVLRGSDGRDVTVARDQIEELKPSPVSLMPEGLLKGLSDREVRDLFAYLRSTQPPK
jgi:putative heme-binding domain-containing protein